MQQILIVEDDRILRKRMAKAILRIGPAVAVQEVGTAEEAIDFLKETKTDLVITDIQMPETSGLMVLAYLNAFLPQVPCFVVTAYGTSRLKYKLPPDLLKYYDKPVDVQELAAAALAAIKRQRGDAACRGIQLPNFVNLAAEDRWTGTIRVSHPEHAPCMLYFQEGEIIDAVSDYEQGDAVVLAALSWESPSYSIEFGIPPDHVRTIDTPLSELLRLACGCFENNR